MEHYERRRGYGTGMPRWYVAVYGISADGWTRKTKCEVRASSIEHACAQGIGIYRKENRQRNYSMVYVSQCSTPTDAV